MINYDGPKASFAVRQHPKQAVEDVRRLRAAVEEQNAERARLLARIAELEGALTRHIERVGT